MIPEARLQEIDRLRKALLGVRERNHGDGPCWCPDWMADDWREDDPLDERIHHESCIAARAALTEESDHD